MSQIFKTGFVRVVVMAAFISTAYICPAQPNLQHDDSNGLTTYYFPDGTVSSTGHLQDGKPEGFWKNFYPDGTLKSEGRRTNHLLDSTWSFYNEQGDLMQQIEYKNGQRQGETRTYRNGALQKVEFFQDDVKQGFVCQYYPSGDLKSLTPYIDGKEEGEGFEFARGDERIITLLTYRDGNLRTSEPINRLNNNNKKHGRWVEFYPNGIIKSEGYYTNGLKNGIFKTFDKEGNLLDIQKYKDGELETGAEAAVILDIRNTYYPDGSVQSTGGYVDGKKEGMHRQYSTTGEITGGIVYRRGEKVAEGIIDEKGNYQGYWKLYYPSGELKAEGNYIDSKKDGEWTYYHRNGQIEHHAKYFEDLPQGAWTWYYSDGKLRRKEFYRKGKEDGPSVELANGGDTITSGTYNAGYKQGEWFYHMGDHTEEGSYEDGERTGEWIYTYANGRIAFRGEYIAGMEVGKHQWYYPNGTLKKEGKYRSGIKTGTWKSYNELGVTELEIKYKNGEVFKINGRRVKSSSPAQAATEAD